MSSRRGSFSLNASHLDSFVTDWYANQDSHFDMDLFGSGGMSLPQEVFEQFNHSSISTSDFDLDFPQDTSWQAAIQTTLPLSDIPEPPRFQPQAPAMPLDSDMRNRDVCFKGEIGTGLWVTNSPIVAPALPLTLSLPLAAAFPLDRIKVPQRDYDQGCKQWSFKRLEPISFSVGGRPGINMGDALRKELKNLDGRDDPVLQDALGTISCRFLFPGYPANHGRCQIRAFDWTRERRPITRGKLAHEVARKLERYLQNMANFTPDKSVEGRWTIGQGSMYIDNMFLARLVSVSKGSFQPEILVTDPLMSRISLGWE